MEPGVDKVKVLGLLRSSSGEKLVNVTTNLDENRYMCTTANENGVVLGLLLWGLEEESYVGYIM